MNVGVLGSIVWDVIDHPAADRVERWGGIAYSLAAAAAAAPEDWTIRPIIRLGSDLAGEADRFLASIPRLERPGGVVRADTPNNRVHLRYVDEAHRHECLTGGVPAWEWAELEPLLDGLDGLFVNLISGFELELETAERLGRTFGGPVYADLHSLLLDVVDEGHRTPRPLDRRERWLACFDVVQVNEAELAMVADHSVDDFPGAAVRDGLAAFLVTRGERGATWVARSAGPHPWAAPPGADVVRGEVAPANGPRAGDPTGCGDVWGATCFIHLMAGSSVETAVRRANAAAARNVGHRGADGLHHHLRERS